jgi:two-component sensor histidine kinase
MSRYPGTAAGLAKALRASNCLLALNRMAALRHLRSAWYSRTCSGVHDASPDCGDSCGPRAWGWQKTATLRRLLVEANALTANLSAAATELEPRREHAEFLMRELAHRGNNQLAVVKGMAVQNGGLWVQSPELELRDLPGDTPNRLRKARAKELSES